jgi:hypothetical protein
VNHKNRQTPWGISDYYKEYGPGIIFYGTPSHGGFWLSQSRLLEMPEEIRVVKLTHDFKTWFEEDCDWSLVALAFPEYFDPRSCQCAIRIATQLSNPESVLYPGWEPWNLDVSAYLAEHPKGRECAAKALNAD